jgi:hypothetical protein
VSGSVLRPYGAIKIILKPWYVICGRHERDIRGNETVTHESFVIAGIADFGILRTFTVSAPWIESLASR